MPNKCTNCGKLHDNNANYLLKGCDNCGHKFFFFVKEEALREAEKDIENLTPTEITEIEKDIRDIIKEKVPEDETVILDVEAIRVIKPGKYKIDVTTLFTQKPIIIRVGNGKYELDFTTLLDRMKRK